MVIVNDRDKIEWHEDMTVQDLLDAMNYTYTMITVTVDNRLIPKDDYADYRVPDNASVNVFHLAHGG